MCFLGMFRDNAVTFYLAAVLQQVGVSNGCSLNMSISGLSIGHVFPRVFCQSEVSIKPTLFLLIPENQWGRRSPYIVCYVCCRLSFLGMAYGSGVMLLPIRNVFLPISIVDEGVIFSDQD